MQSDNHNEPGQGFLRAVSIYSLLALVLSLAAVIALYLLASSSFDLREKTIGFSVVIVGYLAACSLLYFSDKRKNRVNHQTPQLTNEQIERGLGALDEARGVFSGSLRSADAFRLVSSRVGDLVPFQTIVLFLLNESRNQLTSVHADGLKGESHKGQLLAFDEGLAGQAYTTRQVEIDGYMMLDSADDYGSSVAIPLLHDENVFGVVQLFFADDYDLAKVETSLFEGVGTRVAPLMLASIAYERTQANALTDVTTDLPNERAFYLVLENQVAEAQRKRGERPLAMLAIDIKGFQEINCTFGHAAGDRVLNFVAQTVKNSLRQMDFIARALNDEFLVILPTADSEISDEIISRIHAGFSGRKLAINETQSVEIELNIGWASFGRDGETPAQLLSLAQLRKEQAKSLSPSNVLWFPQEPQSSVRPL